MRSCQASTEKSEDHELEYRFIGRDGGELWLRDIVRVVQESGKPDGCAGCLQLASDLARQLGGQLEIDQGPGSGASFAVAWSGGAYPVS